MALPRLEDLDGGHAGGSCGLNTHLGVLEDEAVGGSDVEAVGCDEEGLGIIPWSPIARGMLARPRDRSKGATTRSSDNDRHADRLYAQADWEIVDVVERIAAERGVSMAQVATAWLLSKREVTAPIIGATKLPHLTDAIAALDLTLSADEITALEAPYTPKLPVF